MNLTAITPFVPPARRLRLSMRDSRGQKAEGQRLLSWTHLASERAINYSTIAPSDIWHTINWWWRRPEEVVVLACTRLASFQLAASLSSGWAQRAGNRIAARPLD